MDVGGERDGRDRAVSTISLRVGFHMRALLVLAALPLILAAQRQQAAAPAPDSKAIYIREHYTKREVLIPMRDGVKLFTSIYEPKDRAQKYPVMFLRTPYTVGPYGSENYRSSLGPASEKFMREGFIFAYQDVRGKGKSEGTYANVRPHNPEKRTPKDIDEASDTYDSIEWLVKNLATNGSVGMYGISYPGFYAAMGAIDSHPALKATSPQAPVLNWFLGDDFRHNGVLFLAHAFNFMGAFGRPRNADGNAAWRSFDMGTPDGYDFHLRTGALANYDEKYFKGQIEFWKELMENDTYNAFWKARDPRPYVKNVKPAMMTVGGWFDAEDVFGPLRLYEAAEKQSPGAVNILVEGPWSHGGWARSDGSKLGNVNFGQNTSKFYQDEIEYPFFLFYLKGKGEGAKLPEAYVFETGRNEWNKFDAWPPKEAKAKTLYFHPAGKLDLNAPVAGADSFDEYLSDPKKPVPFTPYITNRMDYNYMTDDQRFAAGRPDVLVYETEPLEEDFRIAGPLKATLHVSTTGTDSDWVVKLVDVFPGDAGATMGGYQMLVRGEPFRGKFRKGFDKPEAFVPGRMEKVEFELPDVLHSFRRGHRIMVQVQSSWYPLADRNPQKFMRINEAKSEDYVKATQRVYRTPQAASSVTVLTLQ